MESITTDYGEKSVTKVGCVCACRRGRGAISANFYALDAETRFGQTFRCTDTFRTVFLRTAAAGCIARILAQKRTPSSGNSPPERFHALRSDILKHAAQQQHRKTLDHVVHIDAKH